jgi:outer membrane protein OmpA-like peptidoglycan-associated protein
MQMKQFLIFLLLLCMSFGFISVMTSCQTPPPPAIEVDILVLREKDANGKDMMRMIVPSLVFAANAGNFAGLDETSTANNAATLRRIEEILNYYKVYRVKVEGHVNPTTPPDTPERELEEKGTDTVLGNQPLSAKRAQTVVDYLVNIGVDKKRLTAVGMGGTKPMAAFEDKDNWWKNRRVEFILEQ